MSVSILQDGTTIPKPEQIAELNYQPSTCECSHLIGLLKGMELFDPIYDYEIMRGYTSEKSDDVLMKVRSRLDKNGIWRLDYFIDKGRGIWLAATPNNMCGTVLSAVEFRDELRDRYGLKILDSLSHCDGCNL